VTAGQPEAGSGASRPRRQRLRRRVLIGALALAAVIAGSLALAMAAGQDRGDLLPPSIATDGRGLSTVAWTEIGRPGLRVAQESAPGTWSLPRLVDEDGGPGSVAVGRDRLAHVAYTAPGGLFVADQLPGSQGSPAFRSRLVTRDAVGRPSIAVAPSGTTAVIYQTGDSRLRVARRKASGRWLVGPAGIAGSQPLLARSGARRFAAAAKSDQRVLLAQGGASAPFRSAGEVGSPSPLLGFDLTTARGRPLVSYVDEELQLVIVARPGRRNGLQVAGATSGIGNFTAVAAASRGRTVVMFREPTFGFVSLVVLRGRSRSATLALSKGQSGDLAVDPGGREVEVAYWDPAGLGLLGARVPLRDVHLSPRQPITTYFPSFAQSESTPISVPQTSLPAHDKASIWLASLALLLAIAAGSLLLLERRHGMRLLPFGIVLAVLAGFGLRGAYLAQLGIYGLPPNDLLPLDRAGVEAVVDALVVLAGSAATICAVGFLIPVGWGRRLLGKLGGVSLPSRRGALLTLAAFLLISLAMGAYVVRDSGLKELFESRQTAFAGSGYQLALLSAGAGAWLVYFAVIGWPSESRERALLAVSGAVTLIPLLFSGARSVVILGFIVPIALLVHLRVRPISLRAAVIGALVLLAFAIATRDLTRGGSDSAVLEEATQANGSVVRALKPALGWTEAAGLDALVLVRTEYEPRFGTDPAVTPGPFAGFAIPRSLWPGKPRSAMDTFSEDLNPWNYDVSKVGKTTTLAGEFEMDAGLAGVFIGFILFALLLAVLGELLAGVGGIFGILVAVALIPRVGAAFWGDSFNAGWGGIVLIVMMALAIAVGRAIGETGSLRSARAPGPG
jgi:hypothetical protein